VIEVTNQENEVVLKPGGNLTGNTVQELKEEFLKILADEKGTVTLDLENVEQIDPAGLAVLITAQNSFNEKGTELSMTNANGELLELFGLINLERFFKLD